MTRRLVLTQGDPDGVGPELLLRAAADGLLRAGDQVVAGRERLRERARRLGGEWEKGWERLEPFLVGPKGVADRLNQFEALREGVDRVLADTGSALVTAPIDKATARKDGLDYPGHTEYLAARAETSEFAMLMAGPSVRVVLATIHLPLRAVPERLSTASIVRAGRLLEEGLRALYSIERPRIGVLGLNPHAGEKGLLGDDELRTIEPAIERLQRERARGSFEGPLPADTAFHRHAEGELDGLVAMYHDQGLAPFKLIHFHDGVNVTLGLPFLRTSPDHGTASDIAGTGEVDPRSFFAAIRLAR